MNILITICARGGSKGIPGKNIKYLNGKPLIAYTINVARNFTPNENCVIGLSTDSREIIDIAKEYGIETEYIRPSHLATDHSGKLSVISDLLYFEERNKGCKFDYIIDLDVTSPLRTREDLEFALRILERDNAALNIFSVNLSNRNPYFNMVEENDHGYFELCKKGQFLTRQSAPKVFDMNASFYIYRRSFFDMGLQHVITDKSLIYVMPHLCFDLDHPIDFEFMEYLILNDKLNFIL